MMMVALTAGCAKEPLAPEQPRPEPVPATEKMELNKSVKFGSSTFRLDIDKDGYNDLLFGYMLVGDASLKVDRYQLITVSPLTVAMPINASEEVALLEKSQPIPMQQNTGFEWYNASSTVLFEKIVSNTAAPLFRGPLTGSTRKYLPLQVFRQGKVYNGWVEISADPEQLTVNIHSAGISKLPDRAIKAGE
jgi:hypothetical protein